MTCNAIQGNAMCISICMKVFVVLINDFKDFFLIAICKQLVMIIPTNLVFVHASNYNFLVSPSILIKIISTSIKIKKMLKLMHVHVLKACYLMGVV